MPCAFCCVSNMPGDWSLPKQSRLPCSHLTWPCTHPPPVQVDHHGTSALQPRDTLDLFRESLRATGSCHFSASPATCAHQLLEAGIVGTRHNRLLHERPAAPPYDEFVLLEESWKGMKRAVMVRAGHHCIQPAGGACPQAAEATTAATLQAGLVAAGNVDAAAAAGIEVAAAAAAAAAAVGASALTAAAAPSDAEVNAAFAAAAAAVAACVPG